MNELVAVEGTLGTSSVEANMAEASTSQPKSKGKGKKKKIALGVANKGKKKDYAKGKCLHCGEKGHWKRNCPKFRAANNKVMKSLFLLEICLVQIPRILGAWIQVVLIIYAILCKGSRRPES